MDKKVYWLQIKYQREDDGVWVTEDIGLYGSFMLSYGMQTYLESHPVPKPGQEFVKTEILVNTAWLTGPPEIPGWGRVRA